MSFFFVSGNLEINTPRELTGPEAHHIGTVRRIRTGEEVQLQDESGKRFLARVEKVVARTLTVIPLSALTTPPHATPHITLLQALISEQNIDLILQKGAELGVAQIVLFQSEHSPHPIPPDRIAHKTERWTQIMRNACEQSGRAVIPRLTIVEDLAAALAHTTGTLVLLSESSSAPLPHVSEYTMVVGPEGGLSSEELALLTTQKATPLSLSTYTLRSETAAITGLAVISALSR